MNSHARLKELVASFGVTGYAVYTGINVHGEHGYDVLLSIEVVNKRFVEGPMPHATVLIRDVPLDGGGDACEVLVMAMESARRVDQAHSWRAWVRESYDTLGHTFEDGLFAYEAWRDAVRMRDDLKRFFNGPPGSLAPDLYTAFMDAVLEI